jgi:Protein of unknown function (DUF2484)
VSLPVIRGLVWLIAANVAAMVPSRDHHWSRAWVLIAVGIPLLGWIVWQAGPWIGLLFMAGGISVLRWPAIFLLQFVRNLWSQRR